MKICASIIAPIKKYASAIHKKYATIRQITSPLRGINIVDTILLLTIAASFIYAYTFTNNKVPRYACVQTPTSPYEILNNTCMRLYDTEYIISGTYHLSSPTDPSVLITKYDTNTICIMCHKLGFIYYCLKYFYVFSIILLLVLICTLLAILFGSIMLQSLQLLYNQYDAMVTRARDDMIEKKL